jgi:hypothetical protein
MPRLPTDDGRRTTGRRTTDDGTTGRRTTDDGRRTTDDREGTATQIVATE